MKLALLAVLLPLAPILTLANPIALPNTAKPASLELAKRETALNAFLTVLLEYLPAVDATINAVAGILTNFEALLVDVLGVPITYNQLGSGCKPYTLIFARGTTEPGNVGILVGPPFIDALDAAVGSGNLLIQGVNNYAATIAGYVAGGDAAGSANLASQIEEAHSLCPSTRLVVSGYSQGCQLVHNAIALVPAAVASWISKVVVFGDPDDGQAIPNVASSKILTYCHEGDDICLNGDFILPAHLTYAENVVTAAAFVTS